MSTGAQVGARLLGASECIDAPIRTPVSTAPRLELSSGSLEALKWLALLLMTLDHVNKHLLHASVPKLFLVGGFEPDTADALLRPLMILLRRLQHDPRHAEQAALKRLQCDAAIAISTRRRTRTRAQAEADGPLPPHWPDAFDPGRTSGRAARLQGSREADRPLCAPFHVTHDLALMVTDAMRDVLLLSHWEQVAGAEPGPGFRTWKNKLRHAPKDGLGVGRTRDRNVVATIVARMTEDRTVQRLRGIVAELALCAPAALQGGQA